LSTGLEKCGPERCTVELIKTVTGPACKLIFKPYFHHPIEVKRIQLRADALFLGCRTSQLAVET
jgi:hypothetical protein